MLPERKSHSARRGAISVFLAIFAVVMISFAALAVDIGTLYSAQAELQRSADAAALAAASALNNGGMDPSASIDLADETARLNGVLQVSAGVTASDVEMGRAAVGADGRMSFQAASGAFDAVRVTVRRTAGSEGGSIALGFSRLMGLESRDLTARAAAVFVPRDIALVVDLSGSMAWDSSLLFWNRDDGGTANTRDCWCALNGPEPARPYEPGTDSTTEYAADTGPIVGWMDNWGSTLTPGSYAVTSDAGLWYIKKSTNSTIPAAITSKLTAAGYTSSERSAITSRTNDSNTGHWQRRVGVMLGMASWHSGMPGGHSGGNGNTILDSNEVTWISYPTWRGTWGWTDYIDYVQNDNWVNDASIFRYRYGLKTFMHFLLDYERTYAQTNKLWAVPEMPQRAIKDAIQVLADELGAQGGLDKLSYEVFATTARHELDLTSNYQSIADRNYARQAAHYDPTTNIGGGIAQGINELKSSRARANSKKYMILLSDGLPNIDESGGYVGDGGASAVAYCRRKAQEALDDGITIYTISVGTAADRSLMQEIAHITGGEEFYAAGNPDEYKDELESIFRRLGGIRPVQLIE
jgi:Mg-chelatase subunit ChlD